MEIKSFLKKFKEYHNVLDVLMILCGEHVTLDQRFDISRKV